MKALYIILLSALVSGCTTSSNPKSYYINHIESCVNIDGHRITIFSNAITDSIHLFVLADTHLWMFDEREEPFTQYSNRMAGAYHQTNHFITGEPTTPEESFCNTLKLAKESGVDALALLGDQISYPSELAIEWSKHKLDSTGIPYYYIAGNHDWHYEGMEGTEIELRNEWTQKRLLPLYNGNNPLYYSTSLKGIKLMFIDNAVYEILPEQLAFFEREIASNQPTILFSHIPLFAHRHNVDYGCGSPYWNSENDSSYDIERRPRWPKEGHNETTYRFCEEVSDAFKENLIATFAGHVHTQSTSIVNGRPEFVVQANARGGYYDVFIVPLPTKP